MFWEKVLEDVDFTKLPNSVYNFKTGDEIKGKEARKIYLTRLKSAIEPSQSDCDKSWEFLLELKLELEQKNRLNSMFDVIDEYHSRYIIY